MDSPSPRLGGRRALITGAGSGIGRACARQLALDGASVAVLDVQEGPSAQVADELNALGSKAMALVADVSDESSMESAVSAAIAEFGGLDTVVTCAGITLAAKTDATTLDQWNLVLKINLTGVFLTLKHTLPHLLEGGSGAIVTIGSVASLVAAGRASIYDASKGGVLQLTRAVAAEYAEYGIRANCVCPGVVTTNLTANSQRYEAARSGLEAEPAGLRVAVPMSRRADPAEIASVVAFLCSDEASFVTGAAIAVDGGFTAV